MTRLSLALVLTVTAAAAVVVVHKRPAQVRPLPASVPHPVGRASRDDVRRPLLLVGQSVLSGEGPSRPASVRRAAPASAADNLNWPALAQCESSGNPRTNTGNGFYGAYQFTRDTWASVGGHGLPSDNSLAEQTYRARLLYAQRGSEPWPQCGWRLTG